MTQTPAPFAIAEDGVDPALVPQKTVWNAKQDPADVMPTF